MSTTDVWLKIRNFTCNLALRDQGRRTKSLRPAGATVRLYKLINERHSLSYLKPTEPKLGQTVGRFGKNESEPSFAVLFLLLLLFAKSDSMGKNIGVA